MSPMNAPLPPTAAANVNLAEQLAAMCEQADLFEKTSLRWMRRLNLVEGAIDHLHYPVPSYPKSVCAECQTEWPCRTKALVTEVLL